VPHELRHSAAALAIASGASVTGVQSMLGHASAAMTSDRYGHLFGDELDAVVDRMDAARADRMRTGAGRSPSGASAEAPDEALTCRYASAPGRIRTCDTRFRKVFRTPLVIIGSECIRALSCAFAVGRSRP